MQKMFIPKRIKVGYQKRDDTYTKRLAYVIYYDAKGKLRKETSWQSWRDKNIKDDEFDNKPQDGFVLNKDVQRCNWSHFGSNRSYIRIYDPRGIEFEITPGNLIFILMHTNCCKRELEGEFVYAWDGTELVLLPAGCEEYKKSSEYTSLQGKKISLKDLVPGRSYTTKQQAELLYLGRFMWYERKDYRGKRVGKKKHIFWSDKPKYTWGEKKNEGHFVSLTSAASLAIENSEELSPRLAELVDKYRKDKKSMAITGIDAKPARITFDEVPDPYVKDRSNLKKKDYFEVNGNIATLYKVEKCYRHHIGWDNRKEKRLNEEPEYIFRACSRINIDNQEYSSLPGDSHYQYARYGYHDKSYKKNELIEKLKNLKDVSFVYEDGTKEDIIKFM